MADESTHRQEVQKLFQLTRMEQKIDESVDTILALQLRQNPSLVSHEAIVREFLEQNIGWESIRAGLEDMYMRAFSEQELREMNAFYITPTGQKVIERLPMLVQERNAVSLQRLQRNIGDLQQRVEAAGK